MSREVHVRICEGVGVRFPHATRLEVSTATIFADGWADKGGNLKKTLCPWEINGIIILTFSQGTQFLMATFRAAVKHVKPLR